MSENATIEIEDKPNDSASPATSAMTEAAARESGLSADEIEAGKKHGLITQDKPAKKAGQSDDDEDADEDEDDDQADDSDDSDKDEEKAPLEAAEEELDPEEEANLIKGYNQNEKTLYWKAKKERLKRQDAQRESEHTKIKLAAAQREIDLLKKGSKTADDDSDEETEGQEGDDDDARVMTVGEFKKMLADQKKEQGKQNAEAQATIVRLEKQEEDFKAEHPDFDEVMDLAKEMMDKKPSLRKMLLLAGADANENAAEIAYDIGRMNPKYKKGGAPKVEKADGASKNNVSKAINNADKRQSSAAVASGGTKRIVSEDDLTVEDAARLAPAAYNKLSRATRDRLLRESCA